MVHPHDIAGKVKLEAEQRRRQQIAKDLEIADTISLMSDPVNRRCVRRLAERADIVTHTSLFNTNAMTMAYNAGRADVLARLREIIQQHCPEKWNLMFQEDLA